MKIKLTIGRAFDKSLYNVNIFWIYFENGSYPDILPRINYQPVKTN